MTLRFLHQLFNRLSVLVGQRPPSALAQGNDLRRALEYSVGLSENGVVIADATRADYPLVFINEAFTRITGYCSAELLGNNCRVLQGDETDAATIDVIRQGLAAERDFHVRLRNYRKDGSAFWNDLHLAPVRSRHGTLTHYVGIQHDVSALLDCEARLAHNALHDALTGLANRSLLETRLQDQFVQARERGRSLALVYIDLDEFKPINDTLGHDVGDAVLQEVARRLQGNTRDQDTVCRVGGDEFAVLLCGLDPEQELADTAKTLLQILAMPYKIMGYELRLTASLGVALASDGTGGAAELLRQADMAMFKAKRRGRNNLHFFTPEMAAKLSKRLTLRGDLQAAVEQGQLLMHYQPIYDRRGRAACFEALLRWKHPERGFVAPAEFIPLAESTGQIIPISRWIMEQVCEDLRWLAEQGLDELRVAANLSPLQFHQPDFVADLQTILDDAGVPPARLELELTEGILMGDAQAGIGILKSLRDKGIAVSIDDFGTGYSSLSYLRELPISKVKLDRSFVAGLAAGGANKAIVQATLSMAHHLGHEVVAEGIETAEQLQCLLDFGCDYFQGFYLARPGTREALLEQRERSEKFPQNRKS